MTSEDVTFFCSYSSSPVLSFVPPLWPRRPLNDLGLVWKCGLSFGFEWHRCTGYLDDALCHHLKLTLLTLRYRFFTYSRSLCCNKPVVLMFLSQTWNKLHFDELLHNAHTLLLNECKARNIQKHIFPDSPSRLWKPPCIRLLLTYLPTKAFFVFPLIFLCSYFFT